VHEHLARLGTGEQLRGHSAIRAPDEQEIGVLLAHAPGEIRWVARGGVSGPAAILRKIRWYALSSPDGGM
jgi:hypothetical protein